jgi:PAS domain-containing protein
MGITRSVEAVQRSSSAEDRLRLVIDTIPVQVTRARPDSSLDFINHRWLEYLGVSDHDVAGRLRIDGEI